MVASTWIPSPYYWPGREGQRPRYVIIHGTAGGTSAENIAAWFQNADAQACAHYVVGRDGAICQCVREADSAWSNGIISGPSGKSGDGVHHDSWWDSGINPNLLTISIELVKPSKDNSDTITAPQQASCFALVKDICQRNGIPMRAADRNGGITGHFSMDPVNRSRCPGPFAWDALWSYLGSQEGGDDDMPLQITDPFAQAFFKDAGGKGWFCQKTGFYIGGAILDYYCRIQGAARLPLSNEIKDIKDHPEIAYQLYEAGVIIFDPNHVLDGPTSDRCYMVKFSSPIVQSRLVTPIVQPLQQRLTAAQTQVTQLQAQLVAAQDSTPLVTDLKNRMTQIHTLSDTQEDFVK
jgi:N-acetyl-anhydromuramyl-L-alanine amidase AmpD